MAYCWRPRILLLGLALSSSLQILGCDDGTSPSEPACRYRAWTTDPSLGSTAGAAVDFVLVMDDSAEMAEEQTAVTGALESFIDALLSPPDVDADGNTDRLAVVDVHLAVVSSDLGAGGFSATGCGDGHDGWFVRESSAPGCSETYPAYLSLDEGDESGPFATDATCVARLGTSGCAFRQPLEAARRALVDHRFDVNAGFLRDDAVLAILFVTNGDDCSVSADGSALFDPAVDVGPLATRCALEGDRFLEPVESYAHDLSSLRFGDPPQRIVGVLAGVPEGSTCRNPDCWLGLPEMRIVADGDRLVPSCSSMARGDADPPRRLLSFLSSWIDETWGAGWVGSICGSDLAGALEGFSTEIHRRLGLHCLARPIPIDTDGLPGCIIEETLTGSEECPDARIDLGLREGRRVCQVCGAGDGVTNPVGLNGADLSACAPWSESGDVWEYRSGAEVGCEATGTIVFHGAAGPQPSSVVTMECLEASCDD